MTSPVVLTLSGLPACVCLGGGREGGRGRGRAGVCRFVSVGWDGGFDEFLVVVVVQGGWVDWEGGRAVPGARRRVACTLCVCVCGCVGVCMCG